jgi:hypothetical protein
MPIAYPRWQCWCTLPGCRPRRPVHSSPLGTPTAVGRSWTAGMGRARRCPPAPWALPCMGIGSHEKAAKHVSNSDDGSLSCGEWTSTVKCIRTVRRAPLSSGHFIGRLCKLQWWYGSYTIAALWACMLEVLCPLVVFLSSSTRVPGKYHERQGHGRFLPNLMQFIIHQLSYVRRYAV